MLKEKVAVIGSGGRESAVLESYIKGGDKGLAIPGNDWIKFKLNSPTFPHLKTTDVLKIIKIIRKEGVSIVDVTQDNALECGLVDKLYNQGFTYVLGPTKKAAEIEWNKVFARQFLRKLNVHQPQFAVFNTEQDGINFVLENPNQAYFIKAAGLCGGKGAIPAKNKSQAIDAIGKMKNFGKAGKVYLIEEWLKNDNGKQGQEFSVFAISDGNTFQILGTAKDYKRAYNFDYGENTGGMGCISPHPNLNSESLGHIEEIFDKTLEGLEKKKRLYKGILYLGGMLVARDGKIVPYVIEFNSRWGDPEAQGIIPGIKNNMYDITLATTSGDLKNFKIETDGLTRVVIAGVTKGYPRDLSEYTNKEIFGIDQGLNTQNVRFYGGSMRIIDGQYFTPAKPSRLFYVVGEGENITTARTKALESLRDIQIPEIGLHYRTDIGFYDL